VLFPGAVVAWVIAQRRLPVVVALSTVYFVDREIGQELSNLQGLAA
jgi:hypothetical protein